jgi:hypothetical protein
LRFGISSKNNHLKGCVRLDEYGNMKISGNRIKTPGSYSIRIIDAKGTLNLISSEITLLLAVISLENSGEDSIVEEINIFWLCRNPLNRIFTQYFYIFCVII